MPRLGPNSPGVLGPIQNRTRMSALLGGQHISNNVTNGGPAFWRTEASTVIAYWEKEFKIRCGSEYLE